ncbi:MAG: glycosyltransferase family 87 protein [Chloroflexota bacterium]
MQRTQWFSYLRHDWPAGAGLLLLLVGVLLVMRLVMPLVSLPPDFSLDFDHQMNAGRAIARGEDPYAYKTWTLDIISVGYAYPPLMAWALVPLVTALPLRYPYLVWVIGEMAAFAASVLMALRSGTRPVRWPWVLLVLGAAFLPFVTRDNLFHGQVDFVLLLLVTGGLVLLSRDRPVAAGIALAAAANVKPFLAILLVYLAWRCRWRAFFAMGFGGAAILVLSFLPTLSHGTQVVEAWLGVAGEMGRPPFIGFPYNHSLYGTIVRLFTPTPFAVAWADSRPLYLALSLLDALVPVAAWLTFVPPGRPRRQNEPLMIFIEAGLLLTLIFACGPVAEANHLLVLAPAIIAVMRLALTSSDPLRRRRWRVAAIAWAVFLVLTAGPLRWTTLTDPLHGVPSGISVLFTGRVGMLLLICSIVMAWSVYREHAVSNPHLSLRGTLRAGRTPTVQPAPAVTPG